MNLFFFFSKRHRNHRPIDQPPLLSTAGPLTQWELIFYGTESPPQDSDPLPDNSLAGAGVTWGDHSGESAEQVVQNSIDDGPALVWHDSHTVRISTSFSLLLWRRGTGALIARQKAMFASS